MACVDINSDVGEGFGRYRIGDDAALLPLITSANVACGFHAGDPIVMHETIAQAHELGVGIGAHPGFNDLWGFGRRQIVGDSAQDVEKMLIYQLGAITAMAQALGARLSHYKLHGALANMACAHAELAQAAARALSLVAPDLIFLVMPGSELERAAVKLDLRVARELYADRAYADDGSLVPRSQAGALIDDPMAASERMVRWIADGALETIGGKKLPVAIDSICIHGDSPGAVGLALALRARLHAAGVEVKPLQQSFNLGPRAS